MNDISYAHMRDGDDVPSQTAGGEYPYTAIIEVTLPPDSAFRLHPTAHAQIAKSLAGRGPVVAEGRGLVRIVFGVAGPDLKSAYDDALLTTPDVLEMLSIAGRPVTSLQVTAPRAERELTAVLVGLGEAADILGVSRQRAAQLAQRADFPEPIQRLRATPVWLQNDVRRFHQHRHKPA